MMAGNNVRRNFAGDARKCSSCESEIIVTEQMTKNGTYRCSPCLSRAAVEWAKGNREKKRKSNNEWSGKNSANRSSATAKWRAKHPEKKLAHQAIQTALRNGSIRKLPCEVCGDTARIHGHHDDYAKPLEVIWLCHSHHMERHAMLLERAK